MYILINVCFVKIKYHFISRRYDASVIKFKTTGLALHEQQLSTARLRFRRGIYHPGIQTSPAGAICRTGYKHEKHKPKTQKQK